MWIGMNALGIATLIIFIILLLIVLTLGFICNRQNKHFYRLG